MMGFSQREVGCMSEEENIAARRKENKLWAKIPEGERKTVQQNYDVGYANVLEPVTGAERRLNVNKPKLARGASQ